MKLCDTCIYRNNVEQLKPCIIYRDNCEYYEKERDDMTDDLISRQAVLDRKYVVEVQNMWHMTEEIEVVNVNDIKALTPVNPQESKMGHWIGHREHCENLGVIPSGLGAYEWCSNCDCGIDVREWHRNNYNYCPTCGCRMVEPQESEVEE